MSSDRAVALDLGALVVVSVAICAQADDLPFMTGWVLAVVVLRVTLWTRLALADRRHGLLAEVGFVALCTVIGGLNDWNTVDRHGVYAYTVPADHPELSTIPTWMLIYWGTILRAIATLAQWRRLGTSASHEGVRLTPRVTLRGFRWRFAVLLVLVVATRQSIYRLYLDPVWSWTPFLLALITYVWALRPSRRELILGGLFWAVGPLVEALYIRLGGLHHYALGWLWGVPLWIQLWWVLAVWVWAEMSQVILMRLIDTDTRLM